MVEIRSDLELVKRLLEKAIIVSTVLHYAFERAELSGFVVTQTPDGAARAASEVFQYLVARYSKSCPRMTHVTAIASR